MKYATIALFLGTIQAVKLDDGKHETEKVHVLEPIPSHVASFFDFPNQRTAFYAQLEGDGKDAKGPEAQKEQYVRKYDTTGYGPNGGAEKVSVPDPRIAHTHTTFYDKVNKLWRGNEAALLAQDEALNADDAEPGVKKVLVQAQAGDGKHETEKTHVLEPDAAHEWAEYNWGIHKGGRGDMTTWY